MKKIYFLSDAHLGSWAIPNGREQEKKLVRFLDSIQEDAAAVYMLGDMFDFWHEYKYVVPKGFTRLLGKISELTDAGIEVHFFTGNHDLWCGNYLETECGAILHRDAYSVKLGNKQFLMAHGDGLGKQEKGYMLLRTLFHNKICQRLFAAIHPRWAIYFGYAWARQSRIKHQAVEGFFEGAEQDALYQYCQHHHQQNPTTQYYIFGHKHIDVELPLADTAKFIILGDWLTKHTYAEFDGSNITIKHYEEQN